MRPTTPRRSSDPHRAPAPGTSRAGDALRTSGGAGRRAGTAPADSTTISCDLIRAGVFFDGTGNSRDHANTGDISWFTNVDLMERIYVDTGGPVVREINGQRREVNYFSRYARGIGVTAGGGTTTRGMAWGTGDEGVENRVAQTISRLLQDLRTKARGMEPCDIWFDSFGFSRGAVAARDFANGVHDGEISFGSSRMQVKFLGIYDTVSSVGSAGSTGNYEGVMLNTNRGVAERIVHITAKDEIRENFPLTLALSGPNISVVGAHSDVGGGYGPRDTRQTFTFDPADYPGVRAFYETRWGVRNNVTGDGDNDSVATTVDEGYIYDTTETVITNTSVHGLQFVPLHLMFDLAKAAGVPLPDALPGAIEGISVTMAADLTEYYNQLRVAPHRATPATERQIRRKYAHMSFNNESNWGIHPHLPETNGTRRRATM